MNRSPFFQKLSLLLAVMLMLPSFVFVAPPKAHAYTLPVVVVGDVAPSTFIEVLKQTLTAASTYTSAVANYADQINTYYLQPLAFVLSGKLLKSMTASVISFVDGQTNGTGAPQFVQNLSGQLQNVGDVQARAFVTQFSQNSNSPFASAITSALSKNYLQQSSLAGFFAQNQCTLNQYSPNINAFLAGDWSQGGLSAWMALTTQDQNNPFTLLQNSQNALTSVVTSAQGAQLAQLNWGQGFLSWCGNSNTSASSGTGAFGSGSSGNPFGTSMPPNTCTNSDGTPGSIQTPGSVINGTLQKALGTTSDKLVAMGNASAEINSIMGNIASVLSTVNLVTQILGGPGSGGLFGAGSSGAAQQYGNSSDYLGLSQSTVSQDGANQGFSGATMLTNVTQYQAAWNTINASAVSASTTVTNLIAHCTTAGGSAVVSAAQTALTTEIAPVFTQISSASSIASAALAMVQKVQAEAMAAGTTDPNGAGGAYAADFQTLQTMPPTSADVANAQQQAQVLNAAIANPDGSLSVNASSIVDQMNLITTNGQALQTSCAMPPTN